jgi:4-amino-4-deoxy-L-arabinose transferase-like glycosyltransferase
VERLTISRRGLLPKTRARSRSSAVPARPRLWPEARWAQAALVLLLVFTLLRGMLVAITIPHFWAPDEDYHFLYAEYLTTQHALPSPDKPLYPPEYGTAVQAINYDAYCCGPLNQLFTGDPKAAVKATSHLSHLYREPNQFGRGVGVVHPPLYQLAAAGVNAAGGNASILTRVTWVRFLTAVLGVLAVYATWLLAAQVLRNTRLQLLAAFLMAIQPMVMYLAGIVNHDSALIAFSTLALAMTAFILRTPPRAAQGLWLGGAIVLALWVKGSALALIPVAALAYLFQWLAHRGSAREVLRSAGLAVGLVVVLAGWWYVRSRIVYGSATGNTTPLTGGTGSSGDASLGQIWDWAREWVGLTYRTYWFHYVWFQGPGAMFGKFVPVWFGAAAMLGLAYLGWARRRTLLALDQPPLRQLVVMLAAVLAFWLPFMVVDVMRRADGLGFYVNGGRYLLPAYGAVVVLFIAGIHEVVRRELRTIVFTGIALSALAFGFWVFCKFSLFFYYGRPGVSELFHRLTFNRPTFVTDGFVWALVLLIGASLAGFAAALWRGRREPDVPPAAADNGWAAT